MRTAKIFVFVALALSVVGCGSNRATLEDHQSKPAVSSAPEPSASDRDKLDRAATEKTERTKRIEFMKSTWTTIAGVRGGEGNFGWLDEAKGFSKEGLDACNLSQRLAETSTLYDEAKNYPDEAATAGLPAIENVRAKFVAFVAGYLRVFSDVAVKGTPVACKTEGEGTRDLPFDTSDLERVLSVMNSNGITPEDVGTTPAKIRAVHLALFRRSLPDLKKRIDEGSGDATGHVGYTMQEWHYTGKELGLTAAQMAKINPPPEGEKPEK